MSPPFGPYICPHPPFPTPLYAAWPILIAYLETLFNSYSNRKIKSEKGSHWQEGTTNKVYHAVTVKRGLPQRGEVAVLALLSHTLRV